MSSAGKWIELEISVKEDMPRSEIKIKHVFAHICNLDLKKCI
jgi:hypothetical protein